MGCLVILVANQCIGADDRRISGNFARRVRKLVQLWDLTGMKFQLQFAICKPELLNDFVACKRHDPQQLGVADLCHFQRWVCDRILFCLYDEPAFIPI